jgi:hypothetical protein
LRNQESPKKIEQPIEIIDPEEENREAYQKQAKLQRNQQEDETDQHNF